MDSIIIKGGNKLDGEVTINGAKNASLPIMAATILASDPVTLTNIPDVVDIKTMQLLLQELGCNVTVIGQEDSLKVQIDANDVNNFVAPYDIVRKMRASIWVLAPLLARFGKARVSLPGGCAIGARLVDMHISVLQALGATVELEHGYIEASANGRLTGGDFTFPKLSVGATVTGILAACLASGTTNLNNCVIEPEIVDLCNFLMGIGAKIDGIGTRSLQITGQPELGGGAHQVIPDRIEAGTYLIAGAITGGNLTIKNANYQHLGHLIDKLSAAGAQITNTGTNNAGTITVSRQRYVTPVDISTDPYPGFATDLQAQFLSLMTLATGESKIQENIFENRFMHIPELNRMGAKINIKGNTAYVEGGTSLSGAEVMASDLRASVSLILAGLTADGFTKVKRVYHLDRGYHNLEAKLRNCGAVIERIKD